MLSEKLLQLRKKYGYSQQEVADLLSITRQTISNWECGQALPTIDKMAALAKLYNVSLDVLMENEIDIIAKNNHKDFHVLKRLIGKKCTLECYDSDLLLDASNSSNIKILDVNEDWIKIEYERMKNIRKKEKVIKVIDLNEIAGFQVVEVL